jgi:hypothetical protein
MARYIFLDNWIFALLGVPEAEARLTAFVRSNGFTVLLTSLSLVELYNPGWQGAGREERGAAAVRFLARVPCVIVNPQRVWKMEAAAHLGKLDSLPLELNLSDLSDDLRESTLLRFLRRDDLFLQQGLDIHAWSLGYEEVKKAWLADVANIIENACSHGDLKRNKAGRFTELEDSSKELFLLSLDLRHADGHDVDAILADVLQRAQAGLRPRLTSVRLSSLCFWYSYVDIDKANQPKRQGSDVGDFYHISLLPYCSTFTTDGTMYRTLQRIRERVVPASCHLMTKAMLEEKIREYV